MNQNSLDDDDGQTLLQVAQDAIDAGLEGRSFALDEQNYAPGLQVQRATFVTLHVSGGLRGCRGSIEAHRSLLQDVAENAVASAFNDPRFTPLQRDEREHLSLHISVLNPMEAVAAQSREVLLRRLRPQVDGLLLRGDGCSAVFLPSVWETLPGAEEFVAQLQAKAGLDPREWPAQMQAWCFTVTSFE